MRRPPHRTTTTVPTTTTTTTATRRRRPRSPPPSRSRSRRPKAWSSSGTTSSTATRSIPSNWTYDIGGWGWGNGESQYYTDRPENARLQNGLLVIEGRQERYEDNYYTSARLKTQELQEFQYGYLEARIKVPAGAGMWPAFWMLGANFERDTEDPNDSNWPFVGEIDIMEFVGREPTVAFGNAPRSRVLRRGQPGEPVSPRRTDRR